MAIKLVSVSPVQDELIDKAIALGDRYMKTLGLITPPAYRKAAEDGGLAAAVEADEVLGYALFGLPKRSARIRLAHLCVAEEQRGRGIAHRLVKGIKERHPERLGIKAKCRRDCNLSGMWRSLGFIPDGEVRGRGRDDGITVSVLILTWAPLHLLPSPLLAYSPLSASTE
ncbi:GNAT family N-acetyltransferase [Streptomyces viridosporus]|uniref:GNAT family N-acetyltransferase n=1 Tax=Streptomyces viridosporus TaxID=67581 RepID=UPI003321A53B